MPLGGLVRGLGRFIGIGSNRNMRQGIQMAQTPAFNPQQIAAAINQHFSQIPGVAKQYFEPQLQRGEEALNRAIPIYQEQAEKPIDYLNEIMSNYEPSAGYQFKKNELMKELASAAASGGYRGSPSDLKKRGELVSGLLSDEMQDWLGNIMNIQGRGLTGLEGEIARGESGRGSLADVLLNSLAQQGMLAGGAMTQANQLRSQQALNMLAHGLFQQQNRRNWMMPLMQGAFSGGMSAAYGAPPQMFSSFGQQRGMF